MIVVSGLRRSWARVCSSVVLIASNRCSRSWACTSSVTSRMIIEVLCSLPAPVNTVLVISPTKEEPSPLRQRRRPRARPVRRRSSSSPGRTGSASSISPFRPEAHISSSDIPNRTCAAGFAPRTVPSGIVSRIASMLLSTRVRKRSSLRRSRDSLSICLVMSCIWEKKHSALPSSSLTTEVFVRTHVTSPAGPMMRPRISRLSTSPASRRCIAASVWVSSSGGTRLCQSVSIISSR